MKIVYLFLLIFLIQSPCFSSNTLNVAANELIYTQNLVFETEARDIAILHFMPATVVLHVQSNLRQVIGVNNFITAKTVTLE